MLLLPEPRHCYSLPRQGLQALVVNRPHHLLLPPLLLLLQMTSCAVRGITGNVRAQLYKKLLQRDSDFKNSPQLIPPILGVVLFLVVETPSKRGGTATTHGRGGDGRARCAPMAR